MRNDIFCNYWGFFRQITHCARLSLCCKKPSCKCHNFFRSNRVGNRTHNPKSSRYRNRYRYYYTGSKNMELESGNCHERSRRCIDKLLPNTFYNNTSNRHQPVAQEVSRAMFRQNSTCYKTCYFHSSFLLCNTWNILRPLQLGFHLNTRHRCNQ